MVNSIYREEKNYIEAIYDKSCKQYSNNSVYRDNSLLCSSEKIYQLNEIKFTGNKREVAKAYLFGIVVSDSNIRLIVFKCLRW